MQSFKEKDKKYIANTYGRFDIEVAYGKGSYVYDINDREYIDLSSGIAVNTLGMADDEWALAVYDQLKKCQHTSNLYYSEPCVRLAEILCERTGAKKVFFGNSGAEANECAIKVARLWGAENKGSEYYNIITLKNSFHGRTITTLAATGQDVFHKDFTPLTEGFLYGEANNLESIEVLLKENKCCAVMMELVQGEGGVLALDHDFAVGVSNLCEKYNTLLVIDEVQTGNGRSGELYAYQCYGLKPDVVSTAKGLGGGLPIGACMMYEKTENVLKPSLHGSTFGGNPIACASAIHVLNRIDSKLLSEVKEKSKYVFDTLNGADGIESVSGLGLMIGIKTTGDVSIILQKCIEKGILPIKAKNKLRLLPALNIPMELLVKAVDIIKQVASENK
ncbi:MAG: aminotransferase class III-fold pyridoxal phosphate-dependent enzyme [Clostridia bacterium]|nr:aminotransferase class III-fold pyridoxal phosphate-dependent enzyme [Clostridia bacterium]